MLLSELQGMDGWVDKEQYNGSSLVQPRATPPRAGPRATRVRMVDKNNSAKKAKKARRRGGPDALYGPGHISKMFDPEDAVSRATRSKRGVEVEDDESSDEDQGSAGSEEPFKKAVSPASTGSNITVYRPPTPVPDEPTKSTFQKPKRTSERQCSLKTSAPRKAIGSKPKPPSVISISSQGSPDIGPMDDVEDLSQVPQWSFASIATEVPQNTDGTPPLQPVGSHHYEDQSSESLSKTNTGAQHSDLVSLFSDRKQAADSHSELSFATSSGNGLFVSDKKRPKKAVIKVDEGTILGSHESSHNFPTSFSPEKNEAAAEPNANKETKKQKRKNGPSIDTGGQQPDDSKRHKRDKGTIGVKDLLPASSRRKRPSRGIMRNGEGLLIGTSGIGDAVNTAPQANGRRKKGVTKAVSLSEMAKSSSTDGKRRLSDV